jgi:hypothetical protein
MDKIKVEFDINISDAQASLGVQVLLDGVAFYTNDHVEDLCHVEHELDDDDGQHTLEIVMSGKTAKHTVVDQAGNITKDATLTISNITVDGIDIGQVLYEKSVYTHDFNGTQPKVSDKFFGTVGCNGTISFEFSTPFYLWLLEHM